VEGRPSFLKKRSKKLLTRGARLDGSARKGKKVFCFFFSKKKSFLPLACLGINKFNL